MKYPYPIHLALMIPVALLAIGCAELDVLKPSPDNSRFYILESFPADSPESVADSPKGPSILIGPGTLAKYLQSSQIAFLSGGNRLEYDPVNRWGEPLEEGVDRLLRQKLASKLNASRTGFLRAMDDFDWDYRVGYHIDELGGQPGESVRLQVTWWIRDGDGQALHFASTEYEQPSSNGDNALPAYVAAIQRLVDAWATDVADRLASFDAADSGN